MYEYQIARDWIEVRLPGAAESSRGDPIFVMEIIIRGSASDSWMILKEIIRLDQAGVTIPELAHGPLESWIHRYGEDWIETIEYEARINPRLRSALRELPNVNIDKDVWHRIERVRSEH